MCFSIPRKKIYLWDLKSQQKIMKLSNNLLVLLSRYLLKDYKLFRENRNLFHGKRLNPLDSMTSYNPNEFVECTKPLKSD